MMLLNSFLFVILFEDIFVEGTMIAMTETYPSDQLGDADDDWLTMAQARRVVAMNNGLKDATSDIIYHHAARVGDVQRNYEIKGVVRYRYGDLKKLKVQVGRGHVKQDNPSNSALRKRKFDAKRKALREQQKDPG